MYLEHAKSAATSSDSAVQLHVLVCLDEQPAIEKKVFGPSITTCAPLVDLSVLGHPAKYFSISILPCTYMIDFLK